MRPVLIVLVVAAVVVALVVGGFWVYISSEHTTCSPGFESREAAERAAERARSAGFDVDVEDAGSGARRPTSLRAHEIAVDFSDGETGDDAAAFREAVQRIAKREGAIGMPACSEISRRD